MSCHEFVMNFYRRLFTFHYNYSLKFKYGTCIFFYKDFGVNFTTILDFEHNISLKIGKALTFLRFVKRNTKQLSTKYLSIIAGHHVLGQLSLY